MSNKGQFQKGMIPWNKGKYGYMSANRTSFTKEDLEAKRIIGEPRKDRDGMICCSKWLMEQQLGRKLESNEIVYHIDGDKYNNELSNLEVITRAELLKRNEKR